MNMRTRPMWLLGLLLLSGTGSAVAVDHPVTVGGATLTFSPSTLTINAGDTVTFTNAGGFHNVHSDPGAVTAFHCSVDCNLNNSPNGSAWSDTVTFPTAGTAGYHCDQHQTAGMVGTITVQGVPVVLQSFDVE